MTTSFDMSIDTSVDRNGRVEAVSVTEGTDSPSRGERELGDAVFEELLGHVWLPSVQADVEYAGDSLGRLARAATSVMVERIGAADAVDLVRRLEELSGVIVAAQARLAVVVDAHTRDAQARRGVPVGKRGAGVASQLGLARRESPTRAGIRLGLAKALTTELPATMEALAAGETSEYRALLVARATAVLEPDVRRGVDAIIGPELVGLSDAGVRSRAASLSYRADPQAFAAAAARSAEERYVSVRPAPTVMAQVTGCVPAADGVACWAALDSAARSAQSAGDERSLAQLRADLFVERLTGRNPLTDGPDIEVGIVMTDRSLLGTQSPDAGASSPRAARTSPGESHQTCAVLSPVKQASAVDASLSSPAPGAGGFTAGTRSSRIEATQVGAAETAATAECSCGTEADAGVDDPAYLIGYGPVPAPWARAIIRGERGDPSSVSEQRVFWRRLFTARDGSVQDIDTRRGHFSGPLRRAIVYRDQVCRTPWCGAPINQVDHVVRVADGGGESWINGQGLCQACNLAKEAPGWRTAAAATGPPGERDHLVVTTTPTGHTYRSRPPPIGVPGWRK